MHALSPEVLADSSESAFSSKQAISIASSSSREIVLDSASSIHRSFRFSRVVRVLCCHVAPLYHVTLLPTLYLPCLNNAYELCIQMPRQLCVCTSMVLFVRMCVQQSYYRHRCGEWRTKSWRISTSRIASSDRQRCVDGRFQDQTKRERVCMTNPRETHDGVAHHARNQILRLER